MTGYDPTWRPFTDQERDILLQQYEVHASSGRLDDLAKSMGRPKTSLARWARQLKITRQNRKKPFISSNLSVAIKAWHAVNPHPRGFLGKIHFAKARDAISQHSFKRWHSMPKHDRVALVKDSKRSWKAGWREIGGNRFYFRSSWEANYARYLEWLRERGEILKWEHEPVTFWFEKIKRGHRSYLIDFRVTESGGEVIFHEVKGWMDAGSKTKIARMGRFYPHVKLLIIDAKSYRSIAKIMSRIIPGWE